MVTLLGVTPQRSYLHFDVRVPRKNFPAPKLVRWNFRNGLLEYNIYSPIVRYINK